MKKLLMTVVLWSFSVGNVFAENVFMGENQNQIMLNAGQGVDSYSLLPLPIRWVPYTFIELKYSQPTTVFRLPARQNIGIVKTIGYGKKYGRNSIPEWNWTKYSTEAVSITWDFALLHGKKWYFGAGLGLAMQGRQNERENTKFLIPMKVFAGYKFAKNWTAELYTQHYSNGDTGDSNYSYNFWGLGLGYSF